MLALLLRLPLIAAQPEHATNIASLIDQARLATLGKRAAKRRVQKAVFLCRLPAVVGPGSQSPEYFCFPYIYFVVSTPPAVILRTNLQP